MFCTIVGLCHNVQPPRWAKCENCSPFETQTCAQTDVRMLVRRDFFCSGCPLMMSIPGSIPRGKFTLSIPCNRVLNKQEYNRCGCRSEERLQFSMATTQERPISAEENITCQGLGAIPSYTLQCIACKPTYNRSLHRII